MAAVRSYRAENPPFLKISPMRVPPSPALSPVWAGLSFPERRNAPEAQRENPRVPSPCGRMQAEVPDPIEIQAYLEMQQRWLTLALQLADDSFPNGSQFSDSGSQLKK